MIHRCLICGGSERDAYGGPVHRAWFDAMWLWVLDSFDGNLFVKMLLSRARAYQYESGVLLLVGQWFSWDIERLEAARPALERTIAKFVLDGERLEMRVEFSRAETEHGGEPYFHPECLIAELGGER